MNIIKNKGSVLPKRASRAYGSRHPPETDYAEYQFSRREIIIHF